MTHSRIDIEKVQKFLKKHAAKSALNEKEVAALMEKSSAEQNFEKIRKELKTTERADDELMQQMKQLLGDPAVKDKLL